MRKQNKYRAKGCYVDNIYFASKKEAKRYGELKLLEKAGEITDLRIHPKYTIFIKRVPVCQYIADFNYFNAITRAYVVEDVKGVRTPVYKLKKKLFEAFYEAVVTEI